MTQEQKDIVLHGAKFEMMNTCINFEDGTVDREKMLKAMQRYADMYHQNELSKLRQDDVVGRSEQLKCDHQPKRYDKKHTSCEKCGKILQMKP